MRQVKTLIAVDQSWGNFGSDDFPSAHDTLFREDFQSSLIKRVEQDTALSKAASITKCHQKGKDALPHPAVLNDQRQTVLIKGALLPGMGADRADVSSHTVRTSM